MARETNRPWGVHSVASMYPANISAGLPDGSYVRAVAMPYDGNRLIAAWWVLTGRAYAVEWPEAGDLEQALGVNIRRRTPHAAADAVGSHQSEAMGEPTNRQIKHATTEYLSHRGLDPYRIMRGGQHLWEAHALAMRAAFRAAYRPAKATL